MSMQVTKQMWQMVAPTNSASQQGNLVVTPSSPSLPGFLETYMHTCTQTCFSLKHVNLGNPRTQKYWILPKSTGPFREDLPLKRIITFGHCPNQGGEAPAQKFWPSFYQVLIPKYWDFLLKSHNICMFSGNFLHQYPISKFWIRIS